MTSVCWLLILLLDSMGRNNNMSEAWSVYLDELTLSATYRLLRIRDLTSVTVLGAIKPGQRLWRWLLREKGVDVVEASFFAGHLKTNEGEAVSLLARRLSGQLADERYFDLGYLRKSTDNYRKGAELYTAS